MVRPCESTIVTFAVLVVAVTKAMRASKLKLVVLKIEILGLKVINVGGMID